MRYFIIFINIVFLSCVAFADEEGFYGYEKIDFFQMANSPQSPVIAEAKVNPEVIENEWAEPIVDPQGKISIYVPPKEVRNFLENPDSTNAKSYLSWNMRRLKKLSLAQEQLAKAAAEISYDEGIRDLNSVYPAGNFKPGQNYLIYFMLKGCHPCAKQFKVVEDIFLHHPEIRIQGFGNEFSKEDIKKIKFSVVPDMGLSGIFGVNIFPSLAVFNKRSERYLLSGYADKDTILRLFK